METKDTKVQGLITSAMGKIHEMADANAILGDPVKLEGGVTVIPVSKVAYGFAGAARICRQSRKRSFSAAAAVRG